MIYVVREILDFVRQILQAPLRSNSSRYAASIRSRMLGTKAFIDTAVVVSNPRNFKAESGAAVYHGSHILNSNGTFSLGEGSHLGAYCHINASRGRVAIGSHVAVGPGTKIIAYSNDYQAGRLVTEVRLEADVLIGNNVFVGANCTILPGTVIEDNVVVGAGAVVKGRLLSNAVYVGIPARRIRSGWFDTMREPRKAE